MMNEYLASMYGTAQQSTEDAEKVAAAQFFAKTAAEHGIDLQALDETQIQDLWNTVFPTKTAEEHEEKKEEKKEKKEEHEEKEAAARQEYLEKKAFQEKMAEADFLGRQMAHAYVDELKKIGAAQQKTKVAEIPPQFRKKEEKGGLHEVAEEHKKEEKEEKKEEKEASAPRTKKAGAFDRQAAEHAVRKVAAANMDPHEAASKLEALLTLGVPEEVKTAAAMQRGATFENALETRSLELLEAVGYPIQWGG